MSRCGDCQHARDDSEDGAEPDLVCTLALPFWAAPTIINVGRLVDADDGKNCRAFSPANE